MVEHMRNALEGKSKAVTAHSGPAQPAARTLGTTRAGLYAGQGKMQRSCCPTNARLGTAQCGRQGGRCADRGAGRVGMKASSRGASKHSTHTACLRPAHSNLGMWRVPCGECLPHLYALYLVQGEDARAVPLHPHALVLPAPPQCRTSPGCAEPHGLLRLLPCGRAQGRSLKARLMLDCGTAAADRGWQPA